MSFFHFGCMVRYISRFTHKHKTFQRLKALNTVCNIKNWEISKYKNHVMIHMWVLVVDSGCPFSLFFHKLGNHRVRPVNFVATDQIQYISIIYAFAESILKSVSGILVEQGACCSYWKRCMNLQPSVGTRAGS